MKQIVLTLATLGLACAAPSIDQQELNGTYPFQPTIGGRIVGGVLANIADLPWQVAILRSGVQICGGAIIAPQFILTGAHCVVPSVIPQITNLNIRSGSALRNVGGLRVAVSKIIIHALYQDCLTCTPDYDIAALYLSSSAIADGLPTAAVPLWEATTTFSSGTLGTVSGWGATSEGGLGSVQLRRVDVPVVSQDQCHTVYGSIISNRTICAGFAAGGRDSCQGDSGGPYVIENSLAGLVSFGTGCARPGVPGVYSSIPGYREWIEANTGV